MLREVLEEHESEVTDRWKTAGTLEERERAHAEICAAQRLKELVYAKCKDIERE